MDRLKLPAIELLPALRNYFQVAYRSFGLDNSDYLSMSLFKAAHFIDLRNRRVDDLASDYFRDSVAIKSRFFPLGTPLFVICIDGRVLTKLIACFHGNSYHVPAGDTKIDFLPVKDGQGRLVLRPGVLSRMMARALAENNSVQIVLDSHLHCAAGGLSANDRHCCEVADAGLYDDVVRKAAMKEAILEYGRKNFPEAKIIVTQMAFNPDDGYSFFGLEKSECLALAKSQGYTKETLETLVAAGKVVSSKALAAKYQEAFQDAHFVCDYRSDYQVSTKKFWDNFQDLQASLNADFRLIAASLEKNDEVYQEQLASLIMASAYNGFLHNHQADGSSREYPYANHQESVITVTVSESGPFSGAESFFVHPESPSISSEIKLGRNLIVGNRQKQRMSALEIAAVSQLFPEYGDYVKAPVLAFFFQRCTRPLREEELACLQKIDWSDVVESSWFSVSDQEFVETYLEKKWPGIPAAIAAAINRLRQQAVALYQPNQAASDDLLSGRIIPVWVLAAPDRRILAVLPFITNGYAID